MVEVRSEAEGCRRPGICLIGGGCVLLQGGEVAAKRIRYVDVRKPDERCFSRQVQINYRTDSGILVLSVQKVHRWSR